MNRHPDIDRTLEAFFLDGPSQMPDRLFQAVLDQVERVPQRRLTRLKLRFTDMSTTARWIAAGAAAVLVVGVGFAALGRGPTEVPGATASPSADASASASAKASADVPTILRHPMLAEHRATAPAPAGQDRSIIQFGQSTFLYNEGLLQSTASAPEVDEISLVSDRANGCEVGDAGRYSWSATGGGSTITFALLEDDCDARAAVIPGEWLRSDCGDPRNFCLGPLEAGRYSSFYIDPFVPDGDPWRPHFGALTYEVPAGWMATSDYPTQYDIEPVPGGAGSGIYVRSEVVASSSSDPCAEVQDPLIGEDAAALTERLASLPGVSATDPIEISIGGLSGFRVDVSRDPNWTQICPAISEAPIRLLYVDRSDEESFAWGLEENTHMRHYLLDLGDGRALLIDIEAPTLAEYEAILDEATAIVESMEFNR
jgi:hypothetical protein